ncbi:peptidoglycan recognition protein family protein [Streptomyces venetus]|uniref:peptidoglycan recognition protein family protein n=1 Tax=Streptomyces venetus TaxID=1701086 RepID=UPI003C306D17
MRGFLASSIGVTCAAALALPLAPPALAGTERPVPTAEAATTARPAPRAGTPTTTTDRTATTTTTDRRAAEPYAPGGTQSLPLEPLTRSRATPSAPGTTEQGLPRRAVRGFSLVGVIWDDPEAELHGRVQVRTRTAGTRTWTGWQDIDTHTADHRADPGTAEGTSGRVRGGTAPLWVGKSDGVELRVVPEPDDPEAAPGPHGTGASALPSGLRLELVDPGDAAEAAPLSGDAAETAALPGTPEEVPRTAELNAEVSAVTAADAANAGLAPLGATEIAELSRAETERELYAINAEALMAQLQAKPYVGPRPRIVTRRGWGADEGLREGKFVYTKKVKAAFVHHTASGNGYRCSQAPSLIRSIYRYHVKSMGWRDIGYNFLIDKCGKIYEGRAGGVAKAVLGAHTRGFNSNSMGIAVLGSYGAKKPSSAAVKGIARLAAWKLGLYGMNPRGKTYLKSGGGNLYRKGKKVRLNVISGHRDGFNTSCPGRKLYGKLGSARSKAAGYQGR